MSDKILDESILDEETEPMTVDELLAHLLQDLISDSPADDVANEFIDDFVLANRSETGQILSLLETPSESLVELLKGIVGQSYQASIVALDERGVNFLEELKSKVRGRMTELANANG